MAWYERREDHYKYITSYRGGPSGLSSYHGKCSQLHGLGLDEWMYIATILYTVLQGSYLVYRNLSNERNTHANENAIYQRGA